MYVKDVDIELSGHTSVYTETCGVCECSYLDYHAWNEDLLFRKVQTLSPINKYHKIHTTKTKVIVVESCRL